MTETDNSTPRPWKVYSAPDGKPYIQSVYRDHEDRRCTAFLATVFCGGENNEANAALIVKAVNSYPALEKCREALAELVAAFNPQPDLERPLTMWDRAAAALALLSEQEKANG